MAVLLPLIKALTALAALFHDWGKASQCFQAKLQPGKSTQKIGDPLRHEWVSCLLLNAFVKGGTEPEATDVQWLSRLAAGEFDEPALKAQAAKNCPEPLRGLPKIAGFDSLVGVDASSFAFAHQRFKRLQLLERLVRCP